MLPRVVGGPFSPMCLTHIMHVHRFVNVLNGAMSHPCNALPIVAIMHIIRATDDRSLKSTIVLNSHINA